VTEVVLDASVVIKWWRADGEGHVEEARSLRAAFEAGDLAVVAPRLLFIEILNAFGRRWRWAQPDLLALAEALGSLGIEVEDPELTSVAGWTARGLTAYDASYVALAEGRGIDLVTDDAAILRAVPDLARSLPDERG
jgi:predicted nucleic acid-binding protein